jgi:hypothetical protein
MFQINVTEEDVQFINEAASILMPMYKAQQFLGRINGQVQRCNQEMQEKAKMDQDVLVADRIAAALKENNNRVVDFPHGEEHKPSTILD